MGDGGEGEMMDTPARTRNNQIAASDAKFEDSPVFNFLNNLSPIQPVKSTNNNQMMNPLISSPLVFASPHVTSLRESRFLRRHQTSDPSRPEFATDGGNNADKNKKNLEVTENITEQQENLDPKPSGVEMAAIPSYGSSKLVVGFEESFTYYCNGLDSSAGPSSSFKAEHLTGYTCNSSSGLVLSVEEASQRVLYGNETNRGSINQTEQNTEASSCDWESLISDASDFLIFESPNNPEACRKSDNARFIGGPLPGNEIGEGSNAYNVENFSTQHGEGSEITENVETCDVIACPSVDNPDQMDSEHLSSFYRGVRRRCLVFEMGGAGRKHADKIPNSISPVRLRSDGNTYSNGQQPAWKSMADKIPNSTSPVRLRSDGNTYSNGQQPARKSIADKIPDSTSPVRLRSDGNTYSNGQQPARKSIADKINSTSPVRLRSDGNTYSNGQQPARKSIAGNNPSRCVLPGIGLHLNALAITPMEQKMNNRAASTSVKRLTGPSSLHISKQAEPHSSVNIDRPPIGLEMVVASSERETDPLESSIMPVEEACPVSAYLANEEINQSSPKKKRRKFEQGEEAGSCKRCNCKKSKCLKLYCECFAAGVYCVEPCACIDCFNKPIHVETVLATRKQIESRNPLAFAPRVIKGPDAFSETMDNSSKTPASARHKRGCNCKKSGCLKKYCECYQGGVGCSINCRCEGCKNAFGRKDGFGVMGMQVEFEEYAKDATEKEAPSKLLHKTAIRNDIEQNMESMPLTTPSHSARESFQHPISSKKRPPRSSGTMVTNSSGYHASQSYGKQPNFFELPLMLDNKHPGNVGEDEIPEMLLGSSPVSGVKLSSPNKKRISPPHTVGGGMRKSRKLILQSIPSFPNLGNNQ